MARHQKRVTRRLAARMSEEENAEEQALRKMRLAEVEDAWPGGWCGVISPVALMSRDVAVLKRGEHGARGKVEGRQKRKAEGANQQAERIEPADGR